MAGRVAFALAGLACVLVAAPAARRLRIPSAVLLVTAGVVYGVLPGPNITLDPTVVLTLLLPPLLYTAALSASLSDIRANLNATMSLSVGLVLATSFAVAGLLAVAVPDLPFPLAVALGAAVAPPDPVAALSVARRAGMPTRLLTLIEGEGLLNDATALTTYQVAVAAAVGSGFSPAGAVGQFLLEAVVGVAVGLGIATVIRWLRQRVDDPMVDNGLSLAVPFACFTAADSAHGSGVLAVVVAGLVLGQQAGRSSTGTARLQTRAVWRLIDFLLQGLVFLLIGQQLPTVLSGLSDVSIGELAAASAATVGACLAVRPVWLFVTTRLPRPLRLDSRRLAGREVAALSWSGTRGVITLAAIFGLPLTAHGAPLPHRDLLLFCAYLVVLATLVGQGLTLAPFVGRLRLPSPSAQEQRARYEARLAAARAGAAFLEELIEREQLPASLADPARASARAQVQRCVVNLSGLDDTADPDGVGSMAAAQRVRRLILDAERDELLRWRDAGRLSEQSLRVLERDLDLQESRLTPQ